MKIEITQKFPLEMDRRTNKELDRISRMCNNLYNIGIDYCKLNPRNNQILKRKDYINMKNKTTEFRELYPYLENICTDLIYDTLRRVGLALNNVHKNKVLGKEFPSYSSWNRYWFSLCYNCRYSNVEIKGKEITVAGFKDKSGMFSKLKVKSKVPLKKGNYLMFRIEKENNKYYGLLVMDIKIEPGMPKGDGSWIAIDQNHENFFVAIDNNGITYQVDRLYQEDYFIPRIDELRRRRDRCLMKSTTYVSKSGIEYTKPSKRWNHYDTARKRLEIKYEAQLKQVIYSLVNYLFDHYDLVMIGDYIPDRKNITSIRCRGAHMVYATHIGAFKRKLLEVAKRRGKKVKIIPERGTTRTCCVCGFQEKKGPDIRSFKCIKTGQLILRDVNSSINIARKGGYEINNPTLDKICYKLYYSLDKNKIIRTK